MKLQTNAAKWIPGPVRRLMRWAFLAWRSTGRAPGWYYQAVEKWGSLAAEPEPITVTLMNGCQVKCNLTDHVERQIYFIGLYEPIEALVLTRLLKPGMTIVDGGANVGQHTVLAANAVSPSGAVHSFEPVPATYAKLCRNIDLNQFENVHANQTALWDETTTVRLGLTANQIDNAGAFGIEMVDSVAEIEAKATTLDDYVRTHGVSDIAFIKLDVEGAELPALQGMRHVLESDRPALLIEICRDTATRLGYDVQDIWELLVGQMRYRGWAVGPWDTAAGALGDLRNVIQQNVLFYDRDRMEPPEMPTNLKSILSWARAGAAGQSR